MHLSLSIQPTPGLHIIPNIKGSCQDRWHSVLQVRTLQSRLSDSNSLTARLQRDMLLVKAKAEALEYAVSEKDAEIDLLRQRQERQETQVGSLAYPEWMLGTHMPPLPPHVPVHADIRHMLFFLVALQGITQSAVWLCHMHQPKHYFGGLFHCQEGSVETFHAQVYLQWSELHECCSKEFLQSVITAGHDRPLVKV